MGGGALDMDTIVSEESWDAALRAAGGVLASIEEVESRVGTSAFVLARPPGHHAMWDRAMGFCLFNNVAIGAKWLTNRGSRVGIIDWDAHHGNGTEASLMDDPNVLYISTHQSPFYPFGGGTASIDNGEAPGTVINIPLPAGSGGDVYREAWEGIVVPALTQFGPDWVIVSAGYDAHNLDQLAGLRLIGADYGWMSYQLQKIHPAGKTIFVLEGGYDLDGIRESVAATVAGISGVFSDTSPLTSPAAAWDVLRMSRESVRRHYLL
jgi:acetoin utilization deacetylase AcuC-like enzyme